MKTRDIKELLILLRDHLYLLDDWSDGMCILAGSLMRRGLISDDERWIIKTYLDNNTPHILYRGGPYWFPPAQIQPRLDWLNEQIAKL